MKFKKWVPIDGLDGNYYVEGIHDDYEGFRILLKGSDPTKNMLRITFDPALSYRNTDEGNLLRTIDEGFESNEGFGNWSFYTVIDSNYLTWFNHESCDIHEGKEIVHYAIYSPNDCLDILSAYPPKVEWLG